MRAAGVGPSSVCRRRIRLAGGRRRDTGQQRGGRRHSSSGDGAQHRRLAQSPRHTRRDIGLATTTRAQVVADYRRAQTVQVGHHDATLDPSRHLVDEPGQAGVVAKPEDRHLRTEPGHVVEALHRLGDGPRMPGILEEHLRAVTVAEILEVRGRLAVRHHQDNGLRVGVATQMPPRKSERVVQVGALLVDAL